MSELFLSVLNMSLTASYVILFVILIRLLLKKAPKVISYALWGVVAFRLIIPFSFESIFSLMPRNGNAVPIPYDIIYQQSPKINSGIEVVDSFVSQSLPAPTAGASANPLQIYMEIGAYIWVLGIIALIVYSLVSILVLKRQLKSAQLIEKNVFEAKNLRTPFVLGLIRPKIYLPIGLNASERSYILLHEQTHIHRKDHIIKILAFLTLSIHWFNPLVWIAFVLMSKDMELSCDERVLKEMDEDIKKPYANSLLLLATGRHILNGSPLAFGEGNVRGRIKNVLNYKKPRFWVVLVSFIILICTCIVLLSNPIRSDQDLSMLNIKNLASISHQKNQLLVSRAPERNEGFNVSARAIAEFLDIVRWTEKKMDSPLELSATIQIEWNEDQELRFYESEPLLAMVRMNNQSRYYTIGRNDYEKILSIIETESSPQRSYKNNNIYPLEFFQLSNAKIENLELDNISKIIEEKIIDKELSTFIFTDNENSEFKGGINLNGKSYYIGQVSMENTPEDLMGIEEIQVFGKKAVKIYGILGANYAQAFYWFVEEKLEEAIIQVDGSTIEIDLDSDGKNEVVATIGTIPETRIYMLKEGKVVVSDINKSIGAESVILQDKELFEVYFEPNKPEHYVFNKDSFIKK